MKKPLLVIIYLCYWSSYSQSVLVKGQVSDTTSNYSSISIINNRYYKIKDAIDNEFNIHCDECKTYEEAYNENIKRIDERSKFWSHPNRRGRFKVNAKLSDSLIFKSERHHEKVYSISDLIKLKKIEIALKPQTCIQKPTVNKDGDSLYIIVGKKIKVKSVSYPYYTIYFVNLLKSCYFV